MRHRTLSCPLACLAAVASLALPAAAQRAWSPPPAHAVENVALGLGEDAPRATLVLRDGRIESVLEVGREAPSGVRVIDGSDLIALPAFLDAYTTEGVETPTPVIDRDNPLSVRSDVRIDMRLANRKGIQPSFDAVAVAELDDDRLEAYREAGFGVALQAPERQILAGRSVLVSLRDAALRDRVIEPRVFAHAAFRASGSGYPSTLMGYISQLRQYFHDVRWHAELGERYDAGRPGPRPAFDAELEAGLELLDGSRWALCEAQSAQDIRRFARCAQEMGFRFGVVGGREAHDVLDVLGGGAHPLVLTLEFGDEPDDPRPKEEGDDEVGSDDEGSGEGEPEAAAGEGAEDDAGAEGDGEGNEAAGADAEDRVVEDSDVEDSDAEDSDAEGSDADDDDRFVYTEPYAVRLDRRERWEARRDGALRLAEAGVSFALGTRDESPADLLKHLRGLVERGLDQQVALDALTRVPAELLGLERRLGTVAAGADATLTLWTANPLADEDAKVAWLFVDGYGWRNDEALEERD